MQKISFIVYYEHTSGHDADQSAAAGGKGDRRGFQPAL